MLTMLALYLYEMDSIFEIAAQRSIHERYR